MMSDPIADFLTRIRNAMMMRRGSVQVNTSRMNEKIAEILKQHQYIQDYQIDRKGSFPTMSMTLKYDSQGNPIIEGLRRISRPGLRVYVGKDKLPKVRGGLGIAIVSTSKGLMTGVDASNQKIGGEVICQVW